jgi:hypothetical protein
MRKLAKKKDYGERTVILKDTSSQIKLYQDIWYNKKGTIDEEFSYTLTFQIFDTTQAKLMQIINYSDTAIVKVTYDLFSVWNWEPENYKLTGDFKIISLTKEKATIKEKIKVVDNITKKAYFFNGTKTYVYSSTWN